MEEIICFGAFKLLFSKYDGREQQSQKKISYIKIQENKKSFEQCIWYDRSAIRFR